MWYDTKNYLKSLWTCLSSRKSNPVTHRCYWKQRNIPSVIKYHNHLRYKTVDEDQAKNIYILSVESQKGVIAVQRCIRHKLCTASGSQRDIFEQH